MMRCPVSDELNFIPDDVVAPPSRPYSPHRPSILLPFFLILAVFFAAMLATGLIAERQFWTLWLTGERADARVIRIVERNADMAFFTDGTHKQLVDKGLIYQFATVTGEQHEGTAWLNRWESQKGNFADVVRVVYAPSAPETNMPASLRHHWTNDAVWRTMLVLDLAGTLGFLVCACGWIRLRRKRLRQRSLDSAG